MHCSVFAVWQENCSIFSVPILRAECISSQNSESVGVGQAQTTASVVSDEIAIIRQVRRNLVYMCVYFVFVYILICLFAFLPRCMECRRGLAMRFLSVRLSVCLSVRPSVCQTRVLWQNGRKICPDFYTMRKTIQSSFMRGRMVGGGRPFLSEILGQPARVGAKSPILNR